MKIALCALALVSLSLAGCVTPLTSKTLVQSAVVENPSSNLLDERIAYYARVYAVPERLVRRVIQKESAYSPAAHHGPFWGLMQLRLETARGMGYRGPVRGLLDTDTNLKYGIAICRMRISLRAVMKIGRWRSTLAAISTRLAAKGC
jgi:soluble lytic murein transglycosylase-like protein